MTQITRTRLSASIDLLYTVSGLTPIPMLESIGGSGDETFTGTVAPDTLDGGGGNDTLSGLGGTDSLQGGDGDDQLDGGAGTDTLSGGAGIDAAIYGFGGAGNGVVFNASVLGGAGSFTLNAGILGSDTLIDVEYVRVTGSQFNDRFTGGSGSDFLRGAAGNDTLSGGAGDDELAGEAGADSLTGGDGDDTLFGFIDNSGQDPGALDGADTLSGGLGDDVLRGNSGNDLLQGGDGNDNLRGDGGDDTLNGGSGTDMAAYRFDELGLVAGVSFSAALIGTAASVSMSDGRGGTDLLIGIEGAILSGTAFGDTLTGSLGGDQISGQGGDDSISGGAGNDSYLGGGSGNDTVSGGGGNDTLSGDAGNDTLRGGPGSDAAEFDFRSAGAGVTLNATVIGTAASVSLADGSGGTDSLLDIERAFITGSAFADGFDGGLGADEIAGAAGNDTLRGGLGADSLDGGEGTDWLEGNAGADAIDGGEGNDVVFFEDGAQGIVIDLKTGIVTNDGFGNAETIANVENLHGSGHADHITLSDIPSSYVFARGGNDTIQGGSGSNGIIAGSGNDSVDGGGGFDTLDLGDDGYDTAGPAAAGVLVDLVGGIIQDGWGGLDTVANIERFRGGQLADTMQGGIADDWFSGNGGADSLAGGDGNDILFGFESSGGEDPLGQDASDTLAGGAGNDILRGNSGNDSLAGGTGNDNLRGDAGNDTLAGGAGRDFASYRFDEMALSAGVTYSLAQVVNAGTWSISDGRGGTDLLSSIESYGISGTAFDDQLTGSALADQIGGNNGNDTLFGGAGRDAINGESGNDWLTGGEGSDSLDGGAGQDVAFFELSITGVEVNLATGVVADDGFGNAETILNVENVHGGLYDDVITLGSGGGYVFGRAGDDLLTGTDGFNKFFGGAGDDTVNGGSGIDELSLIDDLYYEPGPQTQGAVADLATGVVIDGWGGTDRVSGVENLEGTARGDLLQGASAGNRLLGLDGNDTLAGRGGADWLEGGAGNDILYGFLENSGEDPSAQDGADTLIGGDGKDLIRGNSGNDSIAGGAGDDNLRGDAGDDTIDGGEGLDIVVYRFDELGLTAGVVFSGAAIGTAAQLSFADGRGGTDLLIGIERVSLTGTRFADTLTGGSGDDVFRGGRGADLINGGSGTQDWILYDDATAAVTVNLGTGRAFGVEGNDTLSGIEWVTGSAYGDTLTGDGVANSLGGLAGNDRLEGGGGNDSLSGAVGSDTLTGGIGNDFLYGQEGTDWLEGGGGNDFLYGGQGSDTLTGQTGADGFVFDTAQDALNNVDLITDFAVGQDKIWLERGAFGAAGPDGTLAGAAFALGTVATEADDRLIYDNATGNLYYDYDGSGSDSGAVLFATVTAGTALTAASISVFSY